MSAEALAGGASATASRAERVGGARAEAAPAGRGTLAFATVLAVVMVFTTAWIILDASVGASPLLPYSPYFTGWLRHVTGQRLTFHIFLACLLAFTVAYAALLPLAARLPRRMILALLGVLYAIVFVGPVLLSTDVFSYIAYARLGALHGLNPYTHVPANISGDAIYKYVGGDWIYTPTAYGPLYTLFSYPFAFLGVVGAVWGMKVAAMAGCIGTDWLTWRCAVRRGLEPKLALLVVGANPLVVIYSLASFHNDFLMIALMMLAVYLTLTTPARAAGAGAGSAAPGGGGEDGVGPASASVGGRGQVGMLWARLRDGRREAWAAAAVIVGTLVKATVAAILPFMILGRRRSPAVLGALGALVVGLLVSFIAFGPHGVDIVSVLNRDSAYVSTDSFATELAHLLGKPGVYPVDHAILKGLLAVIGVYLLWRTWRGYDWVAAAGWVLLAITVTTTWLLAWYLIWPLPMAASSRDRRLLWAVLVIQALFVLHQISPLFTPEA
ncbi:MAG: hypothetical protein KGJ43_02200 [Acidobacteriota bacterium]|nr:hypothetical protein [Acidobacteriota bacterium]